MPIGGNADTFTITGAKLKVSGGVQVSGSIAYTDDATGFGGVTAQIDNDNTLNITAGKTSGVAKIERGTVANITTITHTNVNNNTTIHIALKNTSTVKGNFVTIGTFADDGTVKVNYTDEYVIGPGETGMVTLRKVAGVLSLFIREMFSSTATDFDTANKPFYIKDGTNYKYPLYKSPGGNLDITPVAINGVSYYQPSGGYTTKSRPPLGIPELIVSPSGNLAIGNSADFTTVNYDVWGVPSSFDFGNIYQGSTKKASFLLENGEASGTFTESGASSGDSYKLFIEKTNTNLTDTVSTTSTTPSTPFAVFHHGTFANGGNPYGHADITAAATAGYFYSDTAPGSYALGTLDEDPTFVQETAAGGDGSGKTTYKFTFPALTSVDHLLVGGGGGGGSDISGGGGAGGYLETKNTTISEGQKTIVVGGGGVGGIHSSTASYNNRGRNGADTSVTGLTTAIGGGGGATWYSSSNYPAGNGGSGGGAGGGRGHPTDPQGGAPGTGTAGQGFDGADSGTHWYPGGGGGASEMGHGRNGTGGSGNTIVGHGGDGKQSTITGFTSYWFAGGGGASGHGTSGDVGNGGKGGGGGGFNRHNGNRVGTGDTNGLTNGENGDTGTVSNTLEPPANTAGGAGGKHTGGGGGGGDHSTGNWGGAGGSGIVIIRTGGNITTGKKIPKVKDITLDPTNESNVLISTQGTGISTVTYSVNGGSEVSTPVSQLSVAHGLSLNTTGTILAYALDASSARLGVKLSKSITAVRGYETITLLTKSGSQTIVYVDNGTTNVTNTYKSAGSNGWNGGWYMATGYTAPVTFEYKASASSSDDQNSYKQIGINSSVVQTYANNDFAMYHYAYYMSAFQFQGTEITDEAVATPWNSTDTFYIVYKTNGDVEWWQAGTKIKTVSWGTGKTVYLSTTFHKTSNGSDNGTFKNIRIKRRQWDGTKYIN